MDKDKQLFESMDNLILLKVSPYMSFVIGSFLLGYFASYSYAHPGNVGPDGVTHVCRTNCEKWGLEEGERHSAPTSQDTQTGGGSNTGSSWQRVIVDLDGVNVGSVVFDEVRKEYVSLNSIYYRGIRGSFGRNSQ